MIEQGWSRKSAALCCAALLCISLAGCGGGGAWEQTESAQSLPAGETAAPKTPEEITALKFISSSKPVVMEIDKGETLKLSAQSAGYQSGFKAFYFYSSDPLGSGGRGGSGAHDGDFRRRHPEKTGRCRFIPRHSGRQACQ